MIIARPRATSAAATVMINTVNTCPVSKNLEASTKVSGTVYGTVYLDKATAVYFTDYLGLDVSSITELRSEFFKASIEYKVAKNTLLRLAAKKINLEGIDDFLVGSTAIAISYDEPTAPAKVLKKFILKREQRSKVDWHPKELVDQDYLLFRIYLKRLE